MAFVMFCENLRSGQKFKPHVHGQGTMHGGDEGEWGWGCGGEAARHKNHEKLRMTTTEIENQFFLFASIKE